MKWFWKKSEQDRDFSVLRAKSHHVKSLDAYMFIGWDFFSVVTDYYPNFNLGVIAKMGKESVKMSIDMIHSTMMHYQHVAKLTGSSITIPARSDLDKWAYLHDDEYNEAVLYLADSINAIKKKVAEQAKK